MWRPVCRYGQQPSSGILRALNSRVLLTLPRAENCNPIRKRGVFQRSGEIHVVAKPINNLTTQTGEKVPEALHDSFSGSKNSPSDVVCPQETNLRMPIGQTCRINFPSNRETTYLSPSPPLLPANFLHFGNVPAWRGGFQRILSADLGTLPFLVSAPTKKSAKFFSATGNLIRSSIPPHHPRSLHLSISLPYTPPAIEPLSESGVCQKYIILF